MLDNGSNPLIWPTALLLNIVALPASNWREIWGYSSRSLLKDHPFFLLFKFIFGVKNFGGDIIIVLHASIFNLKRDLWFWHFLESSQYHGLSGCGGWFV